MFPVCLSFHLAGPPSACESEHVLALMPGLKWGAEADLMKAAEEWPEAVVLIEDWQEQFPNMRWDFPTEIVFPQFPGRIVGNGAVMLPTKQPF